LTLAALSSGGYFHLALRKMVKEEKWMYEKTLRVLSSSRKWTKNCSGLSLLIKNVIEERISVEEGALPGDGIIKSTEGRH